VSNPTSRVFVARLLGLDVFDPLGDRLGRVRDVVVLARANNAPPHAVGLVVEVPGKKRVFVPMTRVTSMDQAQVISTGLVNLRRFEQRGMETLVVAEMFDSRVTLTDGSGSATISTARATGSSPSSSCAADTRSPRSPGCAATRP